MNAIPYDRPEEEWDSYHEGTEEFALPGRRRRQWFTKTSAAVFALLLGVIGFYVGVRVEKSQVSSSSSSAGAFGSGAAARLAAAGRTGAGGATSGTSGATSRAGATGAGAAGGGGGGFRSLFGGGAAGGAGATFGTVSGVSGDTLYISEANGNTVKVTLSSATKVTKNVSVGKNAVRPGDTVVVAGAKNSNGTVSATTLSDTGAGLGGGGGAGGGGTGGSSSTSGSSAVGSLFGGGGG
ncbi:MAG TPA: hypothetical protein VHZ27_00960 [Solirubrobacteraceae bacterium]|jgi:hypothetical protein|nr:hypothetical protein [Solirubrobacteraceae bacterium]